jgi:MFS family permease
VATTSLNERIRTRLVRALRPRQSVYAQNAWNLYGDIAWYGFLFGVAQAFLPVLAIRLGGSDTHVGLLSALPALGAIFFSIPGSRLVERNDKPLPVLLLTVTLNRLGYLGLATVPFFPEPMRANVLVAFVALLTIPNAMALVAFTTLFGHAVRPEDRPHVVSVRNILIGITSTVAALLGGRLLDAVVFPANYQVLFVLAFAASQVSTYYLWRIQLPSEKRPPPRADLQPLTGPAGLVAMFRSDPAFARFTISAIVVHLGLYFAIPLYPIYWVRVLHASDGWIGLVTMIGSATTVLFYPLWARLTSRRGNPYVLGISVFALALYPLFTALSPSIEWIMLVQFWGGAFTGGFTIALFNGLLDVCPEQRRSSYIAAFNTLINTAAFISPLISTSLTSWIAIPVLLLVGVATRLIAAISFWRRVV